MEEAAERSLSMDSSIAMIKLLNEDARLKDELQQVKMAPPGAIAGANHSTHCSFSFRLSFVSSSWSWTKNRPTSRMWTCWRHGLLKSMVSSHIWVQWWREKISSWGSFRQRQPRTLWRLGPLTKCKYNLLSSRPSYSGTFRDKDIIPLYIQSSKCSLALHF